MMAVITDFATACFSPRRPLRRLSLNLSGPRDAATRECEDSDLSALLALFNQSPGRIRLTGLTFGQQLAIARCHWLVEADVASLCG